MKILEANAGALTNFEVLDFLRSKGASMDPTRVLVPVTPSEFKIIEQSEQRFGDDLEGLVDLIAEVLPTHPNQAMAEIEVNENNEGVVGGEQADDNTNETVDGQTNVDDNQIAGDVAMVES